MRFDNRRRRRYNRYRRRSRFASALRTYNGVARNTIGIARTALQVANFVKGLVNVEYKIHTVTDTESVTSAGTVIPLSMLAQGDQSGQRDGRQIKLKSIYMKCYGSHNASGLSSQIIRMIIFADPHCHGSTPTVTQYLDTANVLSNKNMDHRDRWLTLCDKNIVVDGDNQHITMKKFYKKMNHEIDYIGSSAAAGDMGKMNLFLLLITNEPSANYPDFIYNCEIRYLDN